MDASHSGETLLHPADDPRTSRAVSSPVLALPPDLLAESAGRLRIVALLYAFVFFMAAIFPMLLFPADRAQFSSSVLMWGPSTISITVALSVAAVIRSARLPVSAVMSIGVAFEVVSSYGIAAAEFLDPGTFHTNVHWLGLSWVAVWTLLFTVVMPTPPRRALAAALASVSAVPVIVALAMATGNTSFRASPMQFFFWLIFPYLLVVVMAYVGARVVYRLGAEVARAREMGSYRLVERLGQGGMGEVWRAKHRMLARPAAVKLVHPRVAGEATGDRRQTLLARFEREAQATARMRSQHTIELYDFGVSPDGTFYYVMELLDGFDLETFIRRFGPVEPGRAIHLMRQVCHSLAEAHDEGLIHRDIKPANVYLCRYGREVDFIKVLDFGMVKSRDERGQADAALTGDQIIGGTPAFMSPEQVLGDRELDGRSDIYAVGCLGYWLLTGQLVFTGRTPMETMMMHTSAKPIRPSERTEVPIPPALDALIMACLEKDPTARPASADELSDRLSIVATKEEWTVERGRRWWETHAPVRG